MRLCPWASFSNSWAPCSAHPQLVPSELTGCLSDSHASILAMSVVNPYGCGTSEK